MSADEIGKHAAWQQPCVWNDGLETRREHYLLCGSSLASRNTVIVELSSLAKRHSTPEQQVLEAHPVRRIFHLHQLVYGRLKH